MSTDHWSSAAFRDELHAFVTAAVGPPTALEPVRTRPWSTVWRAETRSGTFFAKDNCLGQRHEAALVATLARLAPDRVVPVAAADADRGLLLTPDQGPTMEARCGADVEAWAAVVSAAAALQRELVPHADSLALTSLAPADVPALVAAAVEELAGLDAADPRRLDGSDAADLRELAPRVGEWSDEVAALGLPPTLNHNDLHGDNVFASGLRFFDFGDAVLTEPLAVLLIPLRVAADALDAGPDDPRLARIADAALEHWSDLAPVRALRAALPAALRLATLGRHVSWRRCVASMTPEELRDHGAAPARWLALLAEEPPVGDAGPR